MAFSLSALGALAGKLVYKGFNHYTSCANETQANVLKFLMKKNADTEIGRKYGFKDIHTAEEYRDKVPLSTYSDYYDDIQRMINGEKNILTSYRIRKYIETSGSVGKPKIVPFSSKAAWDVQCMGFCAPVGCAANYIEKHGGKFPKQKGVLAFAVVGRKLKNGERCCGVGCVPLFVLKPFTNFFATSPKPVLFPKEPDKMNIQYLVLRYALPERNVTYIGSMVVTMVMNVFRYLEENWEMLCDDIEKGIINDSVKMPADMRAKLAKKLKPDPVRANELRQIFKEGFDEPIAKKIWPKLGWMYGMISGNLSVYSEKIKKYVGDLPIHNMGYGASECLMAMPADLNEPDAVLLPRSAFFEFLPVGAPEGTRPLLINEVKEGELYEIIITNFSGLYRYRIDDVVKITGFYHESPKVEFQYRANLVMNISDEKTTQPMIDWAAEQTEKECSVQFTGHSIYADYDSRVSRYMLLIEPQSDVTKDDCERFAQVFDDKLRECNKEYDKYRNTNAIDRACVHFLKKGSYEEYKMSLAAKGVNINQIKPVSVISTPEKKEFFFDRIVF